MMPNNYVRNQRIRKCGYKQFVNERKEYLASLEDTVIVNASEWFGCNAGPVRRNFSKPISLWLSRITRIGSHVSQSDNPSDLDGLPRPTGFVGDNSVLTLILRSEFK